MKEMQNVFADPKYVREAWKSVGFAIARNPAVKPFSQYDKDGNETLASLIDQYSYDKLKADIAKLGDKNREPTEMEMILQCQMVRARYDTSAAVFVRDTIGAKPVDESKVNATVSNPYEQLTDEELELLQERRQQLAAQPAATLPLVDKKAIANE